MDFEFADCRLDAGTHKFWRAGTEVHVEPQVFDLLVALARIAPNLLSYDDMIAEIWQGRIVSDATLSARISAARAAVGDSGRVQGIIRTVPRRGVQMVVPVLAAGQTVADAATPRQQTIRYTSSQDGTSLAYGTSGSGGPVLVRGGHWLSHLDHDWESPVWRPWLERLGMGRHLVRYDPRGTGLSQRSKVNLSQSAFTEDFAAIVEAASADPVDVIAASQSAPIALAYAAANPSRIRRIVLVNGFAQGSIVRGDVDETNALVAFIRAGWGVKGSPFVKAFTTLFLPQGTPEELDSIADMQAVSANSEEAAAMRIAVSMLDVTDILASVKAPVLVLSSKGDAVQPPAQSQLLAQEIPGAEFHSLDTTSHVIAPSDPVFPDMMNAVDRFLAN